MSESIGQRGWRQAKELSALIKRQEAESDALSKRQAAEWNEMVARHRAENKLAPEETKVKE